MVYRSSIGGGGGGEELPLELGQRGCFGGACEEDEAVLGAQFGRPGAEVAKVAIFPVGPEYLHVILVHVGGLEAEDVAPGGFGKEV